MAVETVRMGNVDLVIGGAMIAGTNQPTAGTVGNNEVASDAAIAVGKLQHLHKIGTDFGVDSETAPSADKKVIVFRATGAATVLNFDCILLDTGTTTDVKFDLKKAAAGSTSFATILSATVDFTHGDTDNTAKAGTISSPTLAAGDVLRIEMDYTSATGALGPFCMVEIDEASN